MPIASRFLPLMDSRWEAFLQRHPLSSVFHTKAWLEALRRTYGYEAIAFTTSPSGATLSNAVVFCVVDSWLTGRRLVSLPFSDHCELLVDDPEDYNAIFSVLEQEVKQQKLQYVEVRPKRPVDISSRLFRSECRYHHHQIDLYPDLKTLFDNCHKDSIQRKIRRAEREGLIYEEGRSEGFLLAFYRLWLLTRRRHLLPPQPKQWFRNLIDCFGTAAKIRVASKDGLPIAAILTLHHGNTLLYKYGCSDARYHNLGAMHLLLWRSIQEAKEANLGTFDLGRSDLDGAGLATFKSRWGASRTMLTYERWASSPKSRGRFTSLEKDWKEMLARRAVSTLPDQLFCLVGELMYQHIG